MMLLECIFELSNNDFPVYKKVVKNMSKCENPYDDFEEDESCIGVGFLWDEMCSGCRNETLEDLTDAMVDLEKDKMLGALK